jgi:peptide-methionine (S)-S-oxide reductase
VRTRVGYAGGSTESPTYHDLADHTEAFQLDFDPRIITYEELLDEIWRNRRGGRA